jgi:hypothetical protein
MSDGPVNQVDEGLSLEVISVSGNLERPEEDGLSLFRQGLTNKLIWVFGVTVVVGLGLSSLASQTGHDSTSILNFVHEVIPVETSLLGAAIGYYFAEKQGGRKNK